jgi:hypothetical protein
MCYEYAGDDLLNAYKNNTTEMRMTSERNVRPGNAIAMPDTIMANMPKPICAKRIQRGDDDAPPSCSVI